MVSPRLWDPFISTFLEDSDNALPLQVPTPIMIQQLTAEGTAFAVGSTATEILDRDDDDGPLIEAPSLARSAEGVYFLTFSSNCYRCVSIHTSFGLIILFTECPIVHLYMMYRMQLRQMY